MSICEWSGLLVTISLCWICYLTLDALVREMSFTERERRRADRAEQRLREVIGGE